MATTSQVTSAPSSGLSHIDALLSDGPGWNWVTPGRNTLYYTFALDNGDSANAAALLGTAPVAFNAAQQAAAIEALARLHAITGIEFAAVASGSGADLHFAAADIRAASTSGYCTTRWNYSSSGGTVTSYSADAYVYLDNANFASTNDTPTLAGGGFELLLHELGHALGLKHPFEDSPTLPKGQDNTANTLMSYVHVGGPYGDYAPYDVAALMFLYGGDGLGGALGVGGAGRYLSGTTSGDTLTGGNGGDRLDGQQGHDRLAGGGGDDRLDGGEGVDTATYDLVRGSYRVEVGAESVRVQAAAGAEGTDTLVGIERLAFADGGLALDLDGHAGSTARILGAVVGPGSVHDARLVGIGLDLFDSGMTREAVVALALDAMLGEGYTAAAEVRLLYHNLLGVMPDDADLRYWTDALDAGQYTATSLALMAADLGLNLDNIDLVGLSQTGIGYT